MCDFFKKYITDDEMCYNYKYIILHPFKKEHRITENSITFNFWVKWSEAIKIYFNSKCSIIDLLNAIELYYFSKNYFAGEYLNNCIYYEKNIIPLVNKLKAMPLTSLPEGEKLPQLLFEKIINKMSNDNFIVDAHILLENQLTRDKLIQYYPQYTCWEIIAMDGQTRLINIADSVCTKILWNKCETNKNLLDVINNLSKEIDIIKIA